MQYGTTGRPAAVPGKRTPRTATAAKNQRPRCVLTRRGRLYVGPSGDDKTDLASIGRRDEVELRAIIVELRVRRDYHSLLLIL